MILDTDLLFWATLYVQLILCVGGDRRFRFERESATLPVVIVVDNVSAASLVDRRANSETRLSRDSAQQFGVVCRSGSNRRHWNWNSASKTRALLSVYYTLVLYVSLCNAQPACAVHATPLTTSHIDRRWVCMSFPAFSSSAVSAFSHLTRFLRHHVVLRNSFLHPVYRTTLLYIIAVHVKLAHITYFR